MRQVVPLLFTFLVTSCSDSESNVSFDDYLSQVRATAEDGARDCGSSDVPLNTELNTCVLESFSNNMNAFAVYKLDGIDSVIYESIVIDSENSVYHLTYDSDPTGAGSSNNGYIIVFECKDPIPNGMVELPAAELFACSNRE